MQRISFSRALQFREDHRFYQKFEFRYQLHSLNSRSSYKTPPEEDNLEAEVLRSTEAIWNSSHIPLHRIGQEEFLALFIDAGDVSPGSYVVQYVPTTRPGKSQARSFCLMERH